MNTSSRSLVVQVLRAIGIVVLGAICIGFSVQYLHTQHKPYYAQLAAKAAAETQKKTGDQDGYSYNGSDSQ